MKALLGKGWIWTLLGLVLLGAIIWYGGPYLAFADYQPLEPPLARWIAIAVLVLLWIFKVGLRAFSAGRASAGLVKQVVRQEDPSAARASADAQQLRQRFEEAVGALRKSGQGRSVNLYQLPWYMIIGPPGSGKTTAIVNSGLNFPLAQKFGKGALRGVGGTRNCDWWFTDRAILLDTAGRYTTQDSDRASDAAGWTEFLALLRKYRKRRPINGVIVAISLADIARSSPAERAEHLASIRARLGELDKQLSIPFPVYLMFTKCDLLAGFAEFFDDLAQEGRAEVWGTTFSLQASRAGTSAQQFPAELDALLARLDARSLARIEAERDITRRGLIFGFPYQLVGARRAISEFVAELAEPSSFERGVQLRGVYFTSGTQEGTPIDRMLGAIARTFGLGVRALNVQASRGKSYFIQRLLTDVIFPESGLAGVNRGMELRQALVQTSIYGAALALAVVGVIWLSVSYARNREYLESVAAATSPLHEVTRTDAADVAGLLTRLDAYRSAVTAADQYAGSVPVMMRAGLYQGSSMANAATDAYMRELNSGLAPLLAAELRRGMSQLAGQPDKLYEYLKAYLMLGEPRRAEPAQLQFITTRIWADRYPGDATTIERLDTHLAALLADKGRIQPVVLDLEAVERARTSLRQASLPVLMYSRLRLSTAGDEARSIHLDRELGLGAETALIRRSGTALSQPIPALYSRPVFDDVAATGKLEIAAEFVGDSWVLGEGAASVTDAPRLANEMMRLYEDDYIRTWEALVADIGPRPTSSSAELTDMMQMLASPSSPLKRLLVVVEANTNLLKPLKAEPAANVKAALAERLRSLEKMFGVTAAAEKPGARTTRRFEALNKLIEGTPGAAPIDQTLRAIGDIQKQLSAMGGGLGDTSALSAVAAQGQADALGQLRLEARQLPAPISDIVAQIGTKGEALAKGEAGRELAQRYQTEVSAECLQLIAGRYPFAASGNDVALADFGRLFGTGGVFDTFFRERLAPLVDNTRRPWRWKPGAGAVGGSANLLAQFESVERIRQVYFRAGGQLPEARFSVAPEYLDANVRRFALEIDGQPLDYRHGPPRQVAMTWPGPNPGQASVLFEENGGAGPNRSYQGPWALFRLLDDAKVQAQSEVRYQVAIDAGGRSARLTLEATSVRNPFARNELRSFRCGT